MEIIFYFAGLLLGICVFVYIISMLQSAKDKISVIKGRPSKPSEKIEPGTISFRKRPALPPGTRICPMCGSQLTKYEGLYASRIDMTNSSKLMIMGCKYCYKEDNESVK
ncbi:MAG TPA: hypothetical protein PK986_00480 [Spirochaetota bacterium]|nr:hypothetical protein [Spirochaetota bacterium]HQO38921.1 hypothetical protein [Spirochaetota bacterium]